MWKGRLLFHIFENDPWSIESKSGYYGQTIEAVTKLRGVVLSQKWGASAKHEFLACLWSSFTDKQAAASKVMEIVVETAQSTPSEHSLLLSVSIALLLQSVFYCQKDTL